MNLDKLHSTLDNTYGEVHVVVTQQVLQMPSLKHLVINRFGDGLTPRQIRAAVKGYFEFAEEQDINIVLVTTHPVVIGCMDRRPRGCGQDEALYECVWVADGEGDEKQFLPLSEIHDEAWLIHFRMADLYAMERIGHSGD